MHLTERFHVITERSLFRKRDSERGSFEPQAVVREEDQREDLDSFVLKPLYTGKEIAEFRRKNIKDGRFTVTRDTVQSIEDLEKLFFVWQDATEIAENDQEISIGEELENEEGFRFSELTIKE